MDKKNFLFELGVEEIPAAYIAGAIKTIKDHFEINLKKANLEYDELQLFSSPRRFAIKITSLQSQQKDEVIQRVGPTKEMAYTADGKLTNAALGFLRGAGAEESDIIIKQTPKGDKIAIKKEIRGKSATSILVNLIKEAINGIKFQKSMKWGSSKLSFARPIRWILALFDDDIIELEYENITSNNITYGNRFQKLDNPIDINSIDEYERKLADVFVIPNRDKRKEIIKKQMGELFINSDEKVIENNKLLETVTDLVEFPTAVIADFHEKYLKLPQKVVTLTLSEHQKYFSINNKDGKLSNKFLFISNGDPQFSSLIKLGNEKVITARLEDAEFFYKEDTAQPFEAFVPKLSEVTFQQKLGSVLEKTERFKQITRFIGDEVKLEENIKKYSLDGANLCKADLVTLMLGEKEFTKLQGYIGHQYALKSGVNKETALVIEEHYMNGDNAMSLAGSVVAIADKIDTICGIIGVDMIPTGSKDPFALRRAANGVVQIISNNKFELDIHKLIDVSFELLKDRLDKPENNKEVVYDFFKQRVNWLLKQKQIDYDIIESVMHIDHSNIPDLINRAEALQGLKKQEDFIKLVLGFKRVSNIIADEKPTLIVNKEMLTERMEQELYAQYLELDEEIKELLPKKNYKKILEILVNYGSTIDKFFDEVLVNVEDVKIKQNRYNILFCIRELFLQVADLSKLVVEG
ncbi:MAG: glycine--tRNA ligase subunit beta [Candidatus Cloacimonetes bacterium]|jgi:glycyl-tRNA synthetase beta chain|nr:glycine--tRNA ligase subunit beta [Candidatus Cloacimonadota bacterium]